MVSLSPPTLSLLEMMFPVIEFAEAATIRAKTARRKDLCIVKEEIIL